MIQKIRITVSLEIRILGGFPKRTIFLFNSLSKRSIWEPWPPDPDLAVAVAAGWWLQNEFLQDVHTVIVIRNLNIVINADFIVIGESEKGTPFLTSPPSEKLLL